MRSNEGFKEYAQKCRDLDGRVHPPLTDREMIDIFMGTLTGPLFNHLIGSSSAGFIEIILTGERVESSIKSGKLHRGASSSAWKQPFNGKKESDVVYDQKGRN